MVETVVQIKFKKNKAIISIDAEIIRTANRPGNLLEMKIAIDEKSANTSRATISSLRLQGMVKNDFVSRVNNGICNPRNQCREPCNGNRPESMTTATL